MIDATADEQPEITPADDARESLATIRKGWRYVLDPIRTSGGGTTQGSDARPATEDEADEKLPPDARLDTPLTLAFWVRAALDEWPTILERPQRVPQPTTDPDAYPDWTIRMRTEPVDCSNVYAMLDLLSREADRIAGWSDDDGHDFGGRFVSELAMLARVVERVAWPPKGDRMAIGDCPSCGRRVRVKAPDWRRRPRLVPQPTTDPTEYADWVAWVPPDADWEPDRGKPIACRCGIEDSIDGWRERMSPTVKQHMTAVELVAEIKAHFGIRYEPLTIRTWQRRGMIRVVGYSAKGHAEYDRTQVFAALMAREKLRDAAS